MLISKVKNIVKLLLVRIFTKLPLKKNKIVFNNFWGRDFGDNPKYIVEEILRQDLNWDLVWLVNDTEDEFPKEIRKVKYGIFAYYELATAKIWIDNIRNTYRPPKRRNQIYLQTWHGSFGPKPVEKDVEHLLTPEYVKMAKLDGKITDAILSDSSMMDALYKRCFWLNENAEILQYGFPRTDFILQNYNNQECIEAVRKNLRIGKEKYVILYAPTFRDDQSTKGYLYDFDEILTLLQSNLKKECIVIVRLHPNDTANKDEFVYTNCVISGSEYPDMQELIVASDCLITDYSSTSVDFMRIKKPVFLYMNDIEEYKKMRGILNEYMELPFPKAYTLDELKTNITVFDKEKYEEKIDDYFLANKLYDTGEAAKKTVEWLKGKIG